MPVIFPPVTEATEDGLIGVGGDLSVETLISAYSQGIFPWPISSEYPLTWFSPDPRGILFTKEFHCSRSFKKFLKRTSLVVKFNQDFEDIIKRCQEASRPHQQSTWITHPMVRAYNKLFEAGNAFCVGVYQQDQLVGGMYGVKIGQYYAGESMFHSADNASKLALFALFQKFNEMNIPWLDTQMVTEVTASLGAKEIPRSYFTLLLEKQCKKEMIRENNFP